mgnify:CR=1 FL=1
MDDETRKAGDGVDEAGPVLVAMMMMNVSSAPNRASEMYTYQCQALFVLHSIPPTLHVGMGA